jgi:hypothetical protein
VFTTVINIKSGVYMPEEGTTKRDGTVIPVNKITLWCRNFLLNFSTPVFTGSKQGSLMKQAAF